MFTAVVFSMFVNAIVFFVWFVCFVLFVFRIYLHFSCPPASWMARSWLFEYFRSEYIVWWKSLRCDHDKRHSNAWVLSDLCFAVTQRTIFVLLIRLLVSLRPMSSFCFQRCVRASRVHVSQTQQCFSDLNGVVAVIGVHNFITCALDRLRVCCRRSVLTVGITRFSARLRAQCMYLRTLLVRWFTCRSCYCTS